MWQILLLNGMKVTKKLVFCGMMTALALFFLLVGALLPTGRLGLCAAAGLPTAATVIRHSRGAGFLTWAASGTLALILLPDKGYALLYILVFGLYAILKSQIERLGRLSLEWLCKLMFASAVVALFVGTLPELLAQSVTLPKWGGSTVFVAALVLFVAYDLALSRLLMKLEKIMRNLTNGSR